MHMVGHQTVGIHPTTQFLLPFLQIIQVIQVILIRSKDRLSIMAALHDVMWMTWDYQSCCSWHVYLVAKPRMIGKK